MTIIRSHCGINGCVQQTVMLFDMNNMLKNLNHTQMNRFNLSKDNSYIFKMVWGLAWLLRKLHILYTVVLP